MNLRIFLSAGLLLVTAAWVRADVFYPMLMSVSPVAVQAGQVTECEIEARYGLAGGFQVFVSGEGVTAKPEAAPAKAKEKAPVKAAAGKLKVQFHAAANALPGIRDVRVATPHGVSTVGQVVVVRDPIRREKGENDTLANALEVKLPATICGAIEKAEDVDVYRFRAAAGTSWTFHVYGQRLQNKIHDLQSHLDPILTLRNSSGSVLAASDNFFFGDSLLHYQFREAGEYYLEIRDVRYLGDPSWQYAIEAHDRPFVTTVYPSRVVPGIEATVELVGFNLPKPATGRISLPPATPEGPRHIQVALPNRELSNAVPVIVSKLPEVVEATGDKNVPAKAQKIVVPAGVSGRIDAPDQVDCYAFEAKAGEKLTFRMLAREYQSSLDPHIRILNAKGERLTENDDSQDRWTHADSLIENWAVPADGRYIVEIRDVHLRGGPSFVYFLKIDRSAPYFLLEMDTDKTLLAPGSAGVIFLRATRRNGFAGEVRLGVEGLPAGVSASCGRILATGNDGCIILTAAPNAKRAAANITITGTATHEAEKSPKLSLSAVARPLQEIYMPGGGRYHYPVEMHTVSVADPLDVRSVTVQPTEITLKPGESRKIDIVVERAAGFKGNVTIEGFFQHLGSVYGNSLPAGVTVDDKASQTLLTGEQTKGWITLKAAADAKPVEKQQVSIMANVSINFVMKMTYSAQPLWVTVAKP